MGKGSNTSQTQSSSTAYTRPDDAAYQAYQRLLQRAEGVAATPFQEYTGPEVAGINEQQRAGFGAINAGQGAITAAGAPISAADIQRFQDPYTQSVIDATQRDFDVQNARQQSQVIGNAAAQGALGGDRSAVAAALAAEAQGRTQAPVIAGLRSQGYQDAVRAAQADRDAALRSGVAGVQGAQAMVGAGTLEQQTQQAQYTQDRQDYYQKQGYPFQVAQWLAMIDIGVGSQMGGTSTSTGTTTKEGPTPNPWSQVVGLGLTAAGMFSDRRLKENIEPVGKTNDGQTIYRYNFKGDPRTEIGLLHDEVEQVHPEATGEVAGVGMVDYRKATDGAVERFRGGRMSGVHGFAMGGTPWSGESQTWVPTVGQITGGRGAPQAPSFVQAAGGDEKEQGLSKDQMKGIGSLASKAMGMFSGPSSTAVGFDPNSLSTLYARGGGIRRYANGGYAFGGSPDEDLTFDERFGAAFPNRTVAGVGASRPAFAVVNPDEPYRMLDRPSEGAEPPALADWRGGVDRDIGAGVTAQPDDGVPTELPPEVISGRSKMPVMAAEGAEDGPSEAMGYAGRPRLVSGVGAPPAPHDAVPDEGFLASMGVKMTPELKQGLMQAGLAMMANRRGGPGSFLSSLGEAGVAGVGAYNATQQMAQAAQERARKEAFEREKFERPYSQMTMAEKAAERRAREARIPSGYRVNQEGTLEHIPGGPADPEVNRKLAEAKKQALQAMTDETADFLAERVLVGDTRALIGLGRGAQGAENLAKIQGLVAAKAKERGLDASDVLAKAAEQSGVTAAQRTFGTQTARMAINATEAQGAIELGRAASGNVPRTNWVPVNRAIQAYQSGTSDPALAKFGAANLAIINTYARAISPTGVPTVHDKEHAEKLLSTAMGPDAYNAVLDQMNEEIKIAHGAAPKAKKELEDIRKGRPTEQPKAEEKPKKGDRKQFKQGWGVWDGQKWVPEKQ